MVHKLVNAAGLVFLGVCTLFTGMFIWVAYQVVRDERDGHDVQQLHRALLGRT